jgi:hypothetical protein
MKYPPCAGNAREGAARRSQRNLDLRGPPGDFPPVNTKPLLKIFTVSLLALAFSARASAHDDIGTPVGAGSNTFSITVTASNALMRDTDKLKDEATEAANNFCASQNKVIKVLTLTKKSPRFSLGYCTATIVFMSLSPGDPALLPPAPVPAFAAAPVEYAPAPAAPRTLTTDELVAELTKLDDLRKKGILTDDEFQAEKKKVLSHTN